MSKKILVILVLILLVGVNWIIAEEDIVYETDGTESSELVRDGRTLNAIFPYQGTDGHAWFWIVGDSGLVLRYREASEMESRVLNVNHNLMSVSFANVNVGWIVGYINNGDSMWKGVIYKTENGGANWARVPDLNIHLQSEILLRTPLLKVQAYSVTDVWISCGNGYVIRTTNGGADWYTKKPGGNNLIHLI